MPRCAAASRLRARCMYRLLFAGAANDRLEPKAGRRITESLENGGWLSVKPTEFIILSFACPVHRGDTGGAFKRTQRVRETRNQRWKMIWKALIGVFVYRSAVGASLSVPWESLTRTCPPKFSPVSLLCVWRFGGRPLHLGTRLPTASSVLPRRSGLHGTATR